MTFHIDNESTPRLIGPVRIDVFANVVRTVGKGKRQRTETIGVGWQGWNPDPVMADKMSRLPDSGSFYWQGAVKALAAARAILRDDPRVHQIKLESISGQSIGRFYR